MTTNDHLVDILRCPKCAPHGKGKLVRTASGDLQCQEPGCGIIYPVEEGIPVMLTDEGDFLGFRRDAMKKREGRGA